MVITATEELETKPSNSMFDGLSILHLACVFDQEQVICYFVRMAGMSRAMLDLASASDQYLLHTCAWFGTLAPMLVLIKNGAHHSRANRTRHTPLHLAAIKGHFSCTKALIDAGCDLEPRDQSGNTPLHAAALGDSYQCAKELLNYDDVVDVNGVNMDNGTPLHYASTTAMANLLVAAGADPTIRLQSADGSSSSAFSVFLATMPEGCNVVLSSYLKSNLKSPGALDLEIRISFELFKHEYDHDNKEEGVGRQGEIQSLSRVIQSDQKDILKHPVCESFMHLKWLMIRKFVYAYMIFYNLFLMALTFSVLLRHSPTSSHLFDSQTVQNLVQVFTIASAILLCLVVVKNLCILLYSWTIYVKTISNFFELIMIFTTAAYMVLSHQGSKDSEAEVHLGAISLFTAWFNFTLLLGTLPTAGIYIQMVVGVSKDVLKFLSLYTSVIVGFALSFHVVSGHHEFFTDPLTAVLCTLAMMVGEFNFGELFLPSQVKQHVTTQALFVMFLLLVSIIVMNLLVGLAISNITEQFMTAGVHRLKTTVILIQMFDDLMSRFPMISTSIFEKLSKLQNYEEDDEEDWTIYVYPNMPSGGSVFVHDYTTGKKRRTSFTLPPWIILNVHKIFKSGSSNLDHEMESVRQRQDEVLQRLSEDVKSLRKEVQTLKTELKLKT